jgi:hypothetical protein
VTFRAIVSGGIVVRPVRRHAQSTPMSSTISVGNGRVARCTVGSAALCRVDQSFGDLWLDYVALEYSCSKCEKSLPTLLGGFSGRKWSISPPSTSEK